MYSLILSTNHRIARHESFYVQRNDQCRTPAGGDREALELQEDEPVIKLDMVAYLSDGRPFEYTISHKNPKKYLLELHSYR